MPTWRSSVGAPGAPPSTMAQLPIPIRFGAGSMLTAYVAGLVFVNCVTAVGWVAVGGAFTIAAGEKFSDGTLTHREPTPSRFSGWAGGAGRPFDLDELSKEEIHELPPAA